MDNLDNDHDVVIRPSLYERFSGLVFTLTGMPVSRLLTVIVGLLILGWAIQYAIREGDDSREVDVSREVDAMHEGDDTRKVDTVHEADQSSQYTSEQLEKKDYLEAVTFLDGFVNFPFPVQMEKLDLMIERSNRLINQKSDYSVNVKKKLPNLFGLKAITLALNGLDPAPTLELLQQSVDRGSGSLAQNDEHQYLVVATYMNVLVADTDPDFYSQAIAEISAIQETTPVPETNALTCVEAAMKYYHASEDKVRSGKLLQLLGERMSMAKDRDLSDYGSSLIDYPNFYTSYQNALSQTKSDSLLESETVQLLNQIEETPPQSLRTYETLLSMPKQHLHVGDRSGALKITDQLASVASSSAPRIRDAVLPKLASLKKRINLYQKSFPLSGFDVQGKPIEPPESEQTLIMFFNPFETSSQTALQRVAKSPLRQWWSTTTYLVSVEELPATTVDQLKKINSNIIVVDKATSEDWIKKSGIEQVPYLIRLDKEGVVQLLDVP